MLYLDTTLVVAAFIPEAKSDAVEAWLLSKQGMDLAISDWVITEVSAALSIKVRAGQISPVNRANALSHFARACAHSLSVLSISRAMFLAAARLADEYGPGLRAGDALHLALSADNSATLCTLDRRLQEAGAACGLSTEYF